MRVATLTSAGYLVWFNQLLVNLNPCRLYCGNRYFTTLMMSKLWHHFVDLLRNDIICLYVVPYTQFGVCAEGITLMFACLAQDMSLLLDNLVMSTRYCFLFYILCWLLTCVAYILNLFLSMYIIHYIFGYFSNDLDGNHILFVSKCGSIFSSKFIVICTTWGPLGKYGTCLASIYFEHTFWPLSISEICSLTLVTI